MPNMYTEEEKKAIVEEFNESELSLAGFAKEKGIPPTTLSSWLKAERNLAFGAINLKPSPAIPKAMNNTTVFVTDKIRIELKEGFDRNFLQKVIEVLVPD